MLTFIFVILLIIFSAVFLTLGYFDVQISTNTTLLAALNDLGITTDELQVLLGVAILFCQLGIIMFSMLDRIGFAILAIIKPLLRLVPLIAFLTTVWKTYSPIVFNLLPERFSEIFGVSTTDGYLAQSISDGTFMLGVILTIVTMLVFILVSYALRPGDSPQIRQLKAENAKLKKQVRSL
jgi:hypothetical protein